MSQEQKIQKGRILSRVDTVTGWAEKNPQLLDREIGYERETGKYKIGDGTKNWNQLEYAKGADIDPDFVTNVLSELENKSNKDHTHELAEYAELVPINLSEITTLDNTFLNNDGNIEGNKFWGANGIFIINYQGYIEFIASYDGDGDGPDGAGYTSSAHIFIDNDYTNGFSWEKKDNTKFTYKGIVNSNITVYTGYSGVSFEVFNGATNGSVSKDGFISAEDKKKIDNIYIDENNNAGFGNINSLTFNASNTFATGVNNIVGGKAFKIIVDPSGTDGGIGTYALNSVEGIEKGMTYSAVTSTAVYHQGTVENIDNLSNTVTVNNFKGYKLNTANDDSNNFNIYNVFIIDGHPELGTVDIGYNAQAFGQNTIAHNVASHAEGKDTIAVGKFSHAEGMSTIAGHAAHAEGLSSWALGGASHAEGQSTKATATGAHAEGYTTFATAKGAHAEGISARAYGEASHAEGTSTLAQLQNSHAEGYSTSASGNGTHAEGYDTNANGKGSHAEGIETRTTNEGSHAEGYSTEATGNAAHAEGYDTNASGKGSHSEGTETKATNNSAHAEGYNTEASGSSAHAEGHSTKATVDNAHAEGQSSKARGPSSHAEGTSTETMDVASHAEGMHTIATGYGSHAEGIYTKTSQAASHAEGYGEKDKEIIANGKGAHAEGYFTEANGNGSHAEGAYTKTLHYKDNNGQNVSSDGVHAEGYYTIAQQKAAHAEGYITEAIGVGTHTEGSHTKTISYKGGSGEDVSSDGAHAEGHYTTAQYKGAHAEGYGKEGKEITAIGFGAHAEGVYTNATGSGAHAEGYNTKTMYYKGGSGEDISSDGAHAEGHHTVAQRKGAHAEGYGIEGKEVTANGYGAHAEGTYTKALNDGAHAEGRETVATETNQHVQGKYNYLDPNGKSGNYAHIVGNGNSVSERSNAHTLDWNGNAWFAGDVYVGGKEQNEGAQLVTKDYVDNKFDSIHSTRIISPKAYINLYFFDDTYKNNVSIYGTAMHLTQPKKHRVAIKINRQAFNEEGTIYCKYSYNDYNLDTNTEIHRILHGETLNIDNLYPMKDCDALMHITYAKDSEYKDIIADVYIYPLALGLDGNITCSCNGIYSETDDGVITTITLQ